ncbi:hypothetical protein SB725_20510 [Pseudomonas sp. SIMBA_041]|uniref:hypothetical protein n=1 Tax=Pseudomonas sp. SIMBA_041 TaxID=3085782 RepID=UPI00397DA8F1
MNARPPLTIVNISRVFSMFKTYSHAELLPMSVFADAGVQHWQFVEHEMRYPWFYMELVRDHGDDIVGSMLMIPTVPILQQMLLELDDRSWFAQAYLISPGYLRGEKSWVMEPLIEVSIAEDDAYNLEDYIFRVEGGACYSIQHEKRCGNLKITKTIFSAERHLRTCG